MPRISTERLHTGMVLGADVKDMSGRLLLTAGTELQEKQFKVLRTWGILAVEVSGDNDSNEVEPTLELQDLSAESVAAIEQELERRFHGVDTSHPVMQALIEMVTASLVQEYSRAEEGGK